MTEHDAGTLSVRNRPTFKKDLVEMVVSVLVMSFGVVLTVKAQMGASPIVSLPNVLSHVVDMSLGTTVFIVYFILILIEWALIRDRSRILLTLSQLPFTMLFSVFVDMIVWMLGGWVVSDPVEQWALVIAGTAIIGFGCVLEIDANISMLADDGLVLAISQVTKVRLDKVMVIFDICFVASAFILSYAAFQGFVGVGWGTIFAGLTLGLFVRFFTMVVTVYIRKEGSIQV